MITVLLATEELIEAVSYQHLYINSKTYLLSRSVCTCLEEDFEDWETTVDCLSHHSNQLVSLQPIPYLA